MAGGKEQIAMFENDSLNDLFTGFIIGYFGPYAATNAVKGFTRAICSDPASRKDTSRSIRPAQPEKPKVEPGSIQRLFAEGMEMPD